MLFLGETIVKKGRWLPDLRRARCEDPFRADLA
jgi:hypothetical protein